MNRLTVAIPYTEDEQFETLARQLAAHQLVEEVMCLHQNAPPSLPPSLREDVKAVSVDAFFSGPAINSLIEAWRADYLLLILPGVVPRNPASILPMGGIVVGGAMTATTLAGRRVLSEYGNRYGEFEAGLSIGLLQPDAFKLVAGPVAGDALLPALDQTRTVGLVTLPGAFVGMVLGGASPTQAAALQLVVLIGLVAAEALAILVLTELLSRSALPDGRTVSP